MAEIVESEQKKQEDKQDVQQEGAPLAKREPATFTREPFQRMRELARNPLRTISDLLRWDPFREMEPLLPEGRAWSPDFDVRETNDAYRFVADVPGAKKDDIEVSLVGNRLRIAGKRIEEEETLGDTYYACERSYGSFTRIFTLPDTADTERISTDLSDGVLTLVVPKKAELGARKIPIGAREKH